MTDMKPIEQENEELLKPLSEEKVEVQSRSHLTRALTNRAKRNILFIIVGGIFLIILGAVFGPRLLVQFSLFLEKEPTQTQSQEKNTTYIAPPVLNPLPSATNSAEFIIDGSADNAEKVKIYRNGRIVDTVSTKSDATFSTSITLLEGSNEIKARALHSTGEESTFSSTETIRFNKEAPKLTLSNPNNGDEFKGDDSPVTVSGTSENATRITVNGFQAIISSSGDFSYDLPLKSGNNEIAVIAYDEAGNKTEQKINVDYQE